MNHTFLTDRGKIRPHNEDTGGIVTHASGTILAVVADGMGGHSAGDVASAMAYQTLKDAWGENPSVDSIEEASEWLTDNMIKANEAIIRHAHHYPEHAGMGTTLVAAICHPSFTVTGNIGDSRSYIWADRTVQQQSEDHSLVQELYNKGQISALEAESHPQKNILTKALGTDRGLSPDIYTYEWGEGDGVLLCTDGLTNKLGAEDMARMLASHEDLQEGVKAMVQAANDRGGEDNITIAVVMREEEVWTS